MLQHSTLRIECWNPNATNMQSECVMLKAFKRQQWLSKHFSELRHMYIVCLGNS